jgi:hypothetical protein
VFVRITILLVFVAAVASVFAAPAATSGHAKEKVAPQNAKEDRGATPYASI